MGAFADTFGARLGARQHAAGGDSFPKPVLDMPVRIDMLSGTEEGKSFYFDKRKLSIGSGAPSDVRVDLLDATADGAISAEITVGPDGCTLSNASSDELLVNGVDILPGDRRPLRSGDIITLSTRGPDPRFLLVPAIPEDTAASSSAITAPTPRKPTLPAKALAATAANWRLPAVGAAFIFFVLAIALVGRHLTTVASSFTPVPPIKVAKNRPNQETPPDPDDLGADRQLRNDPKPAPVAEPSPPPKPIDPGLSAVCLVGKVESVKLPWCSGWICGPRQVVTSAPMAVVLQGGIDEGGEVFVYVGSGRLIPVESIHFHPSYAGDNPGSLSAAVAVIETREDLPPPPNKVHAEDLPRPIEDVALEVLAFDIPQKDAGRGEEGQFAPKPYNKLEPPQLVKLPAHVVSMRSIAGAPHDLPLLRLDMVPAPGCDGAAVVDASGTVVGTLLGIKSEDAYYVVLSDHLDDFKEMHDATNH